MNDELTKILVMRSRGLPLTAYKSNNIPRVGDILHFTHLGCFRTKSIVCRIADDAGLDENRLMWVEVFVEKCEEKSDVNDVLDKIRTEIMQMPTISLNANDIYKADVLAVINKYRKED